MGPRCSRAFLPVIAALVSALSVGCASSSQISQFEAFAVAGNRYAQAMDALLSESTTLLIDTNSRKLLIAAERVREEDDPALKKEALEALDLKQQLRESDAAIKEHLGAIQHVQPQVRLLASYFNQLAALAVTEAPEQFGAQLKSTAEALNALSDSLQGSAALGPDLVDAADGVGTLIVKGVQRRQLDNELEARKETIARLLRMHQELLELIANQVEHDRRILAAKEYREQVRGPLLDLSFDRAQWMAARRTLLMPTELDSQVAATRSALGRLETAWRKLLAHELTRTDVEAVINDLQPVLTALGR